MTSTSVAEDDDTRQVLEENNEEENEENNNEEENNNNNDEAAAVAQQLLEDTAEQLCEEMKACTDPICTPGIIIIDDCKSQLLATNEDGTALTQAELQSQLGLGCDVLIASMCSQENVQEQCTCPTAGQGSCPEGQFCSVMLSGASGTSYACGDENGAIPTDAAVCTTETPCADEVNEICVATSQGATSGVCLLSCTQ